MTNISKEYTYKLPDDQYYTTDDLAKSATRIYEGPAEIALVVDLDTNKLSGGVIPVEEIDNFNDQTDHQRAVRVDCNEETLLCALVQDYDPDVLETISEDIPQSDPYVRVDPPMPNHTYSERNVEYNFASQSWVKPFPYLEHGISWDERLVKRDTDLRNSDRTYSEDLPAPVAAKITAYRTWLRDFPKIYGVAWDITLDNAGSGFAVGDKISISDPDIKMGTTAGDIILTVTSVDESGAITGTSKKNNRVFYHKPAVTFSDVYWSSNSANGTGLSISVSKEKTIDPWKITGMDNPLS